MQRVWVTSDLHFNHYNILKLESANLLKNKLQWVTTIEQYNNMIINHINEMVGKDDYLYILGDVGFGSCAALAPLVQRINGHKILIYGNHDRFTAEAAYGMGFEWVITDGIMFLPESRGQILLSHYPAFEALNSPYIAFNIHGHLHNSSLRLEQFINANIAENKYYPIDVTGWSTRFQQSVTSRKEKWLDEWYAQYQQFSCSKEDVVLTKQGLLDVEATKQQQNARKS